MSLPDRTQTPVDRVRVIRRSMRCFVFGLIGAIPLLGLSMAWLAFRLQRQVANATGEQIRFAPLHLSLGIGLILLLAAALVESVGAVLAAVLILLALQFFLWRRQYLRNVPLEWNPARHL